MMFERKSVADESRAIRVIDTAWCGKRTCAEMEVHFGVFRLPYHLLKSHRVPPSPLKRFIRSLQYLLALLLALFVVFAAASSWGMRSEVPARGWPSIERRATVKEGRQLPTQRLESPPAPTARPDGEADAVRSRAEPPEWSAPLPQDVQGWVSRIKTIFDREGIPPELVWLVEVESQFKPYAQSRAGAKGLFQFTREGAKAAGLQLWPRDQRLDLDASARAAARHLGKLSERLGSWELVLAAYNAGENRVVRALRNRNTVRFTDIAADLPVETRRYVDCVMALVAGREGIDLGCAD